MCHITHQKKAPKTQEYGKKNKQKCCKYVGPLRAKGNKTTKHNNGTIRNVFKKGKKKGLKL